VGDRIAQIVYADDADRIDISKLLAENEMGLGSSRFDVLGEHIEISHNLLDRSISESGSVHKLFYAANGRIVLERGINLPLGITTYIERSGNRYVYCGIAHSDHRI
jgi:hypothetical protein